MSALPTHRSRAGRSRRGIGLVEAILATVVVGVALVAAIELLGAAARTQRVASTRALERTLSRALMAEILSTEYTDPDGSIDAIALEESSPASRAAFDDVDDYHGFTETGLRVRTGTAISWASGYSWSVSVEWVNPAAPKTTSVTSTGLKRITVVVTAPDGRTRTAVALRGEGGSFDQRAADSFQAIESIATEVVLEDGQALVARMECLNRPEP